MAYWIVLVSAVGIYAVGCVLLSLYHKKNLALDIAFSIGVLGMYIFCVVSVYLDVGAADWNFVNTLPTANVSPFTFVLTSVALLMPRRIRKTLFGLISLLSFGMLAAALLSAASYVARDYALHATIVSDIFAHVVLSLYGTYLALSEQSSMRVKDSLVSGAVIVGVAVVMMVLNAILDTAFFGLAFNGEHNIYNVRVSEYAAVSIVMYFAGLLFVLTVGYFYQKLLLLLCAKYPVKRKD